jgi:hypothetical protein
VDATAVLFQVAQLAGCSLLVGTLILLFKRRVYLDRETGQPSEIDLPLFGKLKTQSPVIILILVAAFLVIYPMQLRSTRAEFGTVEGDIQAGDESVTVTIVPVPRYQEVVDSNGHFSLAIPLDSQENKYRAKFVVGKRIMLDVGFDLKADGVKLRTFNYVPLGSKVTTDSPIKKDVSDERLKDLGILH